MMMMMMMMTPGVGHLGNQLPPVADTILPPLLTTSKRAQWAARVPVNA